LLLSLAAMAILGSRPPRVAVRVALVGAMLAIALYSGIGVLGEIDRIQASVGTLTSTLPPDDPRRVRFDALHVWSTRLMSLNVALALVLLGWEAREREKAQGSGLTGSRLRAPGSGLSETAARRALRAGATGR
jgi:hypothetical protein